MSDRRFRRMQVATQTCIWHRGRSMPIVVRQSLHQNVRQKVSPDAGSHADMHLTQRSLHVYCRTTIATSECQTDPVSGDGHKMLPMCTRALSGAKESAMLISKESRQVAPHSTFKRDNFKLIVWGAMLARFYDFPNYRRIPYVYKPDNTGMPVTWTYLCNIQHNKLLSEYYR